MFYHDFTKKKSISINVEARLEAIGLGRTSLFCLRSEGELCFAKFSMMRTRFEAVEGKQIKGLQLRGQWLL